MADIFHEVDEEVRRERLQRLWERYSIHIIAVAVLIVLGVGGWRGYQWWEAKRAAEAGAAFEAAATLSDQGKHAEAEAAFAKVAAQAPSGYRALARLRAAAELAATDPKQAVKAYDALAADASLGQTMQDLAAVRAGMLLVDSASLDEMRRRLEPLTQSGRAFRHTARELLALAAWRNHDIAAAKHYIEMITNDAETPAGTRTRAEVLSALIAGTGKG
ncbi:MAG TPA: tetratricopeptide repeat protein [Pseudolabrys sp.]|nr:tetratricopeptide repeat protein [Pseudolabrys sp.]